MRVYLILLAIYIAQIFIVGAYPYYKYMKDCKDNRTIGGLMSYMNNHYMGYFKFCMFFPYLGAGALLITYIVFFIWSACVWIYERFIKNIKI